MVDEGRRLLRAEGVTTVLDRVTLERIARALEIDRTSIAELWAEDGLLPHEAFHQALLVSLFDDADSGWTVDESSDAVMQLFVDAGDVRQLDDDARRALLWATFRVSADASLAATRRGNRWAVYTALAAAIATQHRSPDDPVVRAIRSEFEHRNRKLREAMQFTALLFGLEVRPPFTWDVVGALCEALGEGCASISVRSDLPRIAVDESGTTESWSVMAIGLRAVFETCLRPAAGSAGDDQATGGASSDGESPSTA
jgi:hypothetical protein